MKICFVPIDNRPVCYNLAKDIVSIDKAIEFYIPPREFLGDLNKTANYEAIINWLSEVPNCDVIILSLDTIAYGGLVSSRRSADSYEEVKSRLEFLKSILLEKKAKIYAFSSIMRIANNNFNIEEKEYWKDYGTKIFEYSFSGGKNKSDIPQDIIEDYLATRKRNFEINKLYLEWQKEGLFEVLIFSKDDCAEFGFNVDEANELEKMGGVTKTGADEIPLSLISRALKKEIKVYVKFIEPEFKDLISNYEDVSIEKSVLGQLKLADIDVVNSEKDADIVLIVNNFKEKQGELVMGWGTEPYQGGFAFPNKPFAVADVRYANGADNSFVTQLLEQIDLEKFYGYSAWNTSANSLGSLIAGMKAKFKAEKYNDLAFKKLQAIRFLDDWVYQANIRSKIENPSDISELMKAYELVVFNKLELSRTLVKYTFPWNRIFEIEISFAE